jgi:hypothetical protein
VGRLHSALTPITTRITPERRLGDRLCWGGGLLLRNLVDGMHAEIWIE